MFSNIYRPKSDNYGSMLKTAFITLHTHTSDTKFNQDVRRSLLIKD